MGWSGARSRVRQVTATMASATQTGVRAGNTAAKGTGRVIHRMTQASGAGRTGLASLIELTAGSAAADAFVAVALAGTLFFSVSVDEARSRVALALLVTMTPFAVLAPLIGPMLDRMPGRRFILIGTLLARGLLCWGMSGAVQHNDAVTLLPAAFGVLVLQKAYAVTRSAVTPRLLPAEITLVSANARTALASLVAGSLGAVLAASIDLATGGGVGGATWVLRAGTLAYLAAITLGIRLPDRVDAPRQPARPAAEPAPAGRPAGAGSGAGRTLPLPEPQQPAAGRDRWRTLRRVGPVVGEAMRANAALRAFSGYVVFFLAFLLRIEHFPGVNDKAALAALIVAATAGGFVGTALGATLRSRAPHLIMFGMLALVTTVTAACAAFFGLWAALVVALAAAFGQVLGKLALDSIVQHEIGEEIRSSTFAASETLHQLSWVAGGLAGLVMSFTDSGVAGLTVAAVGLAVTFALLLARRRRRVMSARRAAPQPAR